MFNTDKSKCLIIYYVVFVNYNQANLPKNYKEIIISRQYLLC